MNPGASERYHLHWTEPGGKDQDYEIAGDELTIGREGSAGLVLQDPLVSRLHARIRVGNEGIVIEDLQSRNGTFVNSERVTMADLRPGDRVTIGGSILEVTGGDGMTGSMATSAEGMTVVAPASRVAGATEVLAPIVHDPDATHVLTQPGGARPEAPPRGVVPDELLDRPLISELDLRG